MPSAASRARRRARRAPLALAALLALALGCAASPPQPQPTPAHGPPQPRKPTGKKRPDLRELTLAYLNDPTALCNDGSPGAYYYVPASEPSQSNLWLLYLEGGQWCWDQTSCLERQANEPFLTSSKKWPAYQHLGGIFDSDPRRNPWAGANLFYLSYCSSDAWVGNASPASNAFGWYFRGQAIIQAALAQMASDHGFGSSPGHRLLFGGCSAGARGAMFTLDYVQSMVPQGVEVQGLLDSPMWVDVPPLHAGIMPLQNETQGVFTLVNATGRLGDACVKAYPGAEGWKCLYGEYRAPFLTTPFALSASQFDKYQLPYDEGTSPPYGPGSEQLAFADSFQGTVRGIMAKLPTAAQGGSIVFSSACFKHCTSDISSFWGVRVADVSLKDYAAAWYFGPQTTAGDARDALAAVAAGATGGKALQAVPRDALTKLLPGATAAAVERSLAANLPPGVPPQVIEACTGFGCGQCHKQFKPIRAGGNETGVPYAGAPPPPLQKLQAAAAARSTSRVTAMRHAPRVPRWMAAAMHIGIILLLACCAAQLMRRCCGPRGGDRGDAAYFEMPQRAETAPLLPPDEGTHSQRRAALFMPPQPPKPPRGAPHANRSTP